MIALSRDGRRIYVTDEALNTLDVVDAKTLGVTKRIPLSGRPNNVDVAKNGSHVYVGIAQEPGGVDRFGVEIGPPVRVGRHDAVRRTLR